MKRQEPAKIWAFTCGLPTKEVMEQFSQLLAEDRLDWIIVPMMSVDSVSDLVYPEGYSPS